MRSNLLFKSTLSKTAAVTAAALIGLTGATLGAAPANAALKDCPKGYACMWTTTSYQGKPAAKFTNSIKLTTSSNKIRSIANNGNYSRARFYDGSNFNGAYITLNNPARGGQTQDPNLHNGITADTSYWSDKISSAKFI